MCGIFFSLSTSGPVLPNEDTSNLLRTRGPDSFKVHTIQRSLSPKNVTANLTFISTVLSLRGDHIHIQPLVDPESQSVLCWNGEAWKLAGQPIQDNDNDTSLIFASFLEAVNPTTAEGTDRSTAVQKLARVISSISGPFSFVFYDAFNETLFFSRDCLGRRSLLQAVDEEGALKICSLCDGTSTTCFEEVDTEGVHMVDLHALQDANAAIPIQTLRWSPENHLKNPIPPMNKSLPETTPPPLTTSSPCINTLEQKLRQSLALRLSNIPNPPNYTPTDPKIAVLFSGGLDCTLLARLSHDILPEHEPIDLLNVAFENPRVAAAANNKETSVYENCPDRITGRAAFSELQRINPSRPWRFIAIDIPYTETLTHRNTIKRLMKPHNTEMDLSIACALYFASRGQGTSYTPTTEPSPYTTPARVLLSGLGADELFAGYGRHGIAFSKSGFSGLIDEINLDVSRLGKRNLGRDDRILSSWGREARYPFLDEEFVSHTLQMPVWEKCGFGLEVSEEENGEKERGIDNEKKALRLIARNLGLVNTSREKKRAIQFGSRTAKMERGRVKGTEVLT